MTWHEIQKLSVFETSIAVLNPPQKMMPTMNIRNPPAGMPSRYFADGWLHKDFHRPVSGPAPDVLLMLTYPVLCKSESQSNELE